MLSTSFVSVMAINVCFRQIPWKVVASPHPRCLQRCCGKLDLSLNELQYFISIQVKHTYFVFVSSSKDLSGELRKHATASG